MAKRRTSGIQRRERAAAADNSKYRRLDQRAGASLPDWRLLAIGGVIVVGVIIIAIVLLFGSGPNPHEGIREPDAGGQHVPIGTTCRSPQAPCGADPYTSLPATSGPHWVPEGIANWGVYTTPQNESQVVHNLEHGGIVIWYDPERLDAAGVQTLTDYVNRQVSSGVSGRFKFILTPWGGNGELPAPVVATAWLYMLPLETADTSAIDDFARIHYQKSPEPNGGPGPPGT